MWMVCLEPDNSKASYLRSDLLDRLLEFSPDVFEGPQGEILVDLSKQTRYWQLPELLASGPRAEPLEFEKLVLEFHRRDGLSFVLGPTAAWAVFLLRHVRSDEARPLHLFRASDAERALAHAPLSAALALIPDALLKSEDRAAAHDLLARLDELGFDKLGQIREVCRTPIVQEEFLERFGGVFDKLLKRIDGRGDWELTPYVPPVELVHSLFAHADADPMEQVLETLQAWERRLAARRSLLKGFEISFRSDRRRDTRSFRVELPRASREAARLHKLVFEHWLQLQATPSLEGFSDELDSIRLRSLGLEDASDRQLNLFDPKREETEEEWNLLVARLLSRAERGAPIQIGSYRPNESWLPEEAAAWVDWGRYSALPPLQDHPKRPLLFYSTPKPLREPRLGNEEDFWRWLESRQALASLEKIRDEVEERSYARVDSRWVFWDHARGGAFVQGIFEFSPTQ